MEDLDYEVINIGNYYDLLNLVKLYNETKCKEVEVRELLYDLMRKESAIAHFKLDELLKDMKIQTKRNSIKKVEDK